VGKDGEDGLDELTAGKHRTGVIEAKVRRLSLVPLADLRQGLAGRRVDRIP
jgi:hypothetical protein